MPEDYLNYVDLSAEDIGRKYLKDADIKWKDRYTDFFTPLSDELASSLSKDAFKETEAFKTDLVTRNALNSLSTGRSKLNTAYASSGLKSGAWDSLGQTLYSNFKDSLSKSLFGVGEEITKLKSKALSDYEEWKKRNMEAVSSIASYQ